MRPPVAVFLAALTLTSCGYPVSRDEVGVVRSPDGRMVARLFETNGGATTDFGYLVTLSASGSKTGIDVGSLYGAVRSDCAYGVNLRWRGPQQLVIEYLTAKSAHLNNATMRGRPVTVVARTGMKDETAPCGGMAYNLGNSGTAS
jgi:hypothetical protein